MKNAITNKKKEERRKTKKKNKAKTNKNSLERKIMAE